MEITRIAFDQLNNTRDLGQFSSADGRRIRPRTLLRSGNLHDLCLEDRAILKNDYCLKTIIDLRTPSEQKTEPDTVISGVNYISIPILDDQTLGITLHDTKDVGEINEMIHFLKQPSFDAEAYMTKTYRQLINNPVCRAGYRQFFSVLLDAPSDGAILWHCTAGKDRVGIATMFLLYILGVPFDTIVEDYLATNSFGVDSLNRLITAVTAYSGTKGIIPNLDALFRVSEKYIDAVLAEISNQYESIDAFLDIELGLTEERRTALQDKFLIK